MLSASFFRVLLSLLLWLICDLARFVPKYFEKSLDKGFALLTSDGESAVQEELKEDSAYCVEGTELKAEVYE